MTALIGAEGWDGAPRPDDRWHLSASNVGKALAAPGLERWGDRETARRVVDALPMLTDLASANADAAREFVRTIKYSGAQGALSSSDRGTAVHAYLEARLTGQPVPDFAPHGEQLAPYLAQLEQWLAAFRPEAVEVEQVVYNPAHGLAGRLDLKLRFPADVPLVGGTVRIVDLKSKDKSYDRQGRPLRPFADAHPLQLAIYAHATHAATWLPRVTQGGGGGRFYLANDAELALATAPAPVDGALLLQVTPEHCHAYPVDIGPEVYAYARCVADAWRWLHLVSGSTIGDPVPATATA